MDLKTAAAGSKFLFSVKNYHQMGWSGFFHEDDPVELLNGEIYVMAPIGAAHANMVKRLVRLFERKFQVNAITAVQDPIALDEMSEPEPDIALLTPEFDLNGDGLPRPEDVLLLIEVADSSLHYDKEFKVPAYARGGIREVWLIDLTKKRVYIHRDPRSDGNYASLRTIAEEDTFTPVAFPELQLTFADLGWK